MPAHRQFNRIGDGFAAGQRAAHPLMSHRDPIGNRDGGEFTRCAQRLFDAHFGRLCLTVQRDIAGCRFVPAGGNTDKRLMNFFFRHAHRIIIRPMRCPRRTFGNMTAW